VSGPVDHRSVWISLWVCVAETAALAVAARATGSTALITQTATSLADVAGGVFLLIGVVSSVRAPDDRHPLGYGRERFFWSLLAAVGVFLGGFGAALAETVHASLDPRPPGSYLVGFSVLAITVGLDTVGLVAGLRPFLRRAARRGLSPVEMLWRGTDPAATTVVLTNASGVLGGLLAAAGLAGARLTGSPVADTLASALIALVLLAASIVLLHTNRELVTGRGLPQAEVTAMRDVVSRQPGVEAVPDLFAIFVGPGTLIVAGDVIFADRLDVPAVEAAIVAAATALRSGWPAAAYVYLNPVAASRPRRHIGGETGSRSSPLSAGTPTGPAVRSRRRPWRRARPRPRAGAR
jgi:cation diffusion facilitator family transporter